MTANSSAKYHIAIRIMHWLMAILILGMIGIGWYMADLPKENPLKGELVSLHKSCGALLLILFFVRLAMRIVKKAPALPETIPPIERNLANLGHKLLYLFMLIVPLSGYAMSNLYGYAVKMFGIPMPILFSENKDLGKLAREAHELVPYILLGIIALHFAGAIKHRFFDKPENDVLGRML